MRWRSIVAIAAFALSTCAAPALAQTSPGVADEALPGQGAALPATSTTTGKGLKLRAVATLCTDGTNYVVCPVSGGTKGQQTSVNSQSVTPASDSDFASKANQTNGTARTMIVDNGNIALTFGSAVGGTTISSGQITLPVRSYPWLYDPVAVGFIAQPGDARGAWVHGPPSTPVFYGGTIAANGGTLAIPFVSTADQDVFNPSTATLWCSWDTPTVNGAKSYPIAPQGSFRPPNRPAGTYTCLGTAANQAVGSWRY